MNLTVPRRIPAIIAALGLFSVAALADISGTATVNAGSNFNFDTGANVASGGDISFTGTSITFQGSAKGGLLPGLTGSTVYTTTVTAQFLQVLAGAGLATTTPIAASSLTAGTASGSIIALQTNSGNLAKLLVITLSGSSITFQYTTFGATAGGGGGGGGGGGANAPTVNAVLNNSSLIPNGFPNSGIAPSTLFVIQGSNMATPGSVAVLQDSTKGLPTTLNGASISVSAGGKTFTPAIYYSTATQIAAVLPAATPTGPATLTVSYNNSTSAQFNIQVVSASFGFDIYNGSAVATDASSGALVTYAQSAKPGQVLVFWGTGLGADTTDANADTTYIASPQKKSTPVTVYIGGVQLPASAIAYSGASIYPGVDVIGLTIPQGVLNGCYVPVVVVTGTAPNLTVSNFATMAIMNAGGSCSDPLFGTNGSQLGSLSSQVNVRSGSVVVGQLSEPIVGTVNIADASFSSVSGTVYASSSSSGGTVSVGACIVTETVSGGGGGGGSLTITPLDAGTVSLQGPLGNYPLPSITKGSYSAQLPATAIPSTGGAFVFNGTGGADVGTFTATVNLPNPLLNWTNQAAAVNIDRTQGLQVTWTGGAPGTYVYISGASVDVANKASGGFACYAPQSALQFTVPSYVLLALPAGSGQVILENITNYSTFSASGIDIGVGIGFTGVGASAKFQ